MIAVPIRSLDAARDYVQAASRDLDPESRYVRELLEEIERASDLDALETFLARSSRAARQIGAEFFESMSLEQKLRSNLLTPETYAGRFSSAEAAYLLEWCRERSRGGAALHIACAPCSIGLEPLWLAKHLAPLAADISILGIDREAQYVAWAAARGPIPQRIAQAGLSRPATADAKVRFSTVDILEEELPGGFDLVLCRNFLGFFGEAACLRALGRVLAMLAPGGLLGLDEFVLSGERGRALARELFAAGLAASGGPTTFFRRPSAAAPARG